MRRLIWGAETPHLGTGHAVRDLAGCTRRNLVIIAYLVPSNYHQGLTGLTPTGVRTSGSSEPCLLRGGRSANANYFFFQVYLCGQRRYRYGPRWVCGRDFTFFAAALHFLVPNLRSASARFWHHLLLGVTREHEYTYVCVGYRTTPLLTSLPWWGSPAMRYSKYLGVSRDNDFFS